MREPYLLMIDTWEEGGKIDEALLNSNNVAGMFVRINDITGGHHVDANFNAQWIEASKLAVRVPYFVYNPWVTGQANYDWISANLPIECGSVFVDVEVRYSAVTPEKYSAEFMTFWNLLIKKYHAAIYTGEGFLDMLAYWPKDADYWWASYPAQFYTYRSLTWEDLREELALYDLPANASKVPGRLMAWQFTGDRIIMEGCEKRTDVNVYYGDLNSLIVWANNAQVPVEPPVVNTDQIIQTHKGVTLHKITRFGANCFVHVIDPTIAKIKISNSGYQRTSVAVKKANAQIGTNGGGWHLENNVPIANEMWVSDGVFMLQPSKIKDNRPYIDVSQLGVIAVSPNAQTMQGQYNSVGFDRLLVIDGKFNQAVKELFPPDARTGSGVTVDNKWVLLSVEGNDQFNQGLTFPQMASVLIEFGCVTAGNNDGGSSSTVVNTAISPDPLFHSSDPQEAFVLNHILVFAEPLAIPEPPIGDNMDKFYRVDVTNKERSTPSMYQVTTRAGQAVGAIITASNGVLYPDTDIRSDAIFVKTPDGWFQPISYKGNVYMTEIPDPNVPPVSGSKKYVIEVDIDDASQKATSVSVDGVKFVAPNV